MIGALASLMFIVVICIVAGIVAGKKNRTVAGWVVGTALFVPIIIILFVLEALPEKSTVTTPKSE